MKLKQVLLNILAIIMAFEFIGTSILCIKYPNWGGLVVITVSAIAFVIAFNKAFFYKYEHQEYMQYSCIFKYNKKLKT